MFNLIVPEARNAKLSGKMFIQVVREKKLARAILTQESGQKQDTFSSAKSHV